MLVVEFEFMSVKITKCSPFNYLSLLARKFTMEKWDFLREIYYDLSLK